MKTLLTVLVTLLVLIMGITGCSVEEAKKRLGAAGGVTRRAVEHDKAR